MLLKFRNSRAHFFAVTFCDSCETAREYSRSRECGRDGCAGRETMSWLEPVTLRSSRVTLAPLHRRHRDELIEAVNDGELFRLWYTSVPAPQTMEAEIDRRLSQQAAGLMLP